MLITRKNNGKLPFLYVNTYPPLDATFSLDESTCAKVKVFSNLQFRKNVPSIEGQTSVFDLLKTVICTSMEGYFSKSVLVVRTGNIPPLSIGLS